MSSFDLSKVFVCIQNDIKIFKIRISKQFSYIKGIRNVLPQSRGT